ncbi:hypothetical protein JZ751_014318, partial [Albula glossodonta]
MPANSKLDSPLKKANRKVVRNPKCARCRNHGFVVQLKGHAGKCPFSSCDCWKCSLITERTKIMAIQRQMGKKQEPFSAVSSSHREAQPQAGDSIEDIDVIHDSTNMSDSESVPNLNSLAGQRSDPVNVRKESVIKMPPARRIEADGKTYAELVTVQSVNEETNKSNELREPIGTPTTITGGGPGAVALNCENMRYGGPPWNGVQATAHFPGEYVIAAVAQRDMYSGELMSLPFPIKLYSPYPNGYRYPTILLNVPPPPPPVPGSFHDPHLGFPNFHSSALPYSPEARPVQVLSARPHVRPGPVRARRSVLEEQVELWWFREPRKSLACYCVSVTLVLACGAGGVGVLSSTTSTSGAWRLGVGVALCLLALAVLLKQLLSSAVQDMGCVRSWGRIRALKSGGPSDHALILLTGVALLVCGSFLLGLSPPRPTPGATLDDMAVTGMVLLAGGGATVLGVAGYTAVVFLLDQTSSGRRLSNRAATIFTVSGRMSDARRPSSM